MKAIVTPVDMATRFTAFWNDADRYKITAHYPVACKCKHSPCGLLKCKRRK